MGSKSSKQPKTPKDPENEDSSSSFDSDSSQLSSNEEMSPEESESRVTSGIDSEVSTAEPYEIEEVEPNDLLDSASEDRSVYSSVSSVSSVSDSDSIESVVTEESERYEIDSIQEELSNQLDFNPDPLNSSCTSQTDEVESELQGRVEDERILCGADAVEYRLPIIQNFKEYDLETSDEDSYESDKEQESSDHSDHISIEFSTAPYPIEREYRQNGMILFHVNEPLINETESFWRMIIEKQIPTIKICSSSEDIIMNRTKYVPNQATSDAKCGVFIVKCLGTVCQLSMNLTRQQNLIYEMIGENMVYKHSVTHFQEIQNSDPIVSIMNEKIIEKHVSHQPNPQYLVIGSM